MTVTIIITAIVLLPVLAVIILYNTMVSLRNNRENAFADIDVQLLQRNDLIPQMVETVRGYAKHESTTLQAVIEARNGVMQAHSIDEKVVADNKLTAALQGLKVTVERYPELKANQNFMNLQEEIADIENKLAAIRRFFNSATREYNTYIQKFPANILAEKFNFRKETFFETVADKATVSQAPKIQF
jgi:LemA protein